MTDEIEIDIAGIVRRARAEMSDSEYRRRFRAGDFIIYSPKQRELLNSTAQALYAKTANQFGKTTAAGGMVTFQTTQIFPPWYAGWKQPKLNLVRPHTMIVWCFAPTWQMLRDGLQSRILGDVASGQVGTGIMPAENIVSLQMARGIAGAVDSAVVKRADGSTAVIRFKTYEQGREAAQSESVDFVVCDEMPTDMGLWSELLARLSATSGRIWLTATPRKQQSAIAQWYKEADHPERQIITATIDDAAHLTDAMREEMKARFANNPLEAATRLYGADFAGGGAIFNTPMANYVATFDPAEFPSYYKWIIGLDPSHGGLSASAHPAGAVLCGLDPDSQTLFVCDCLRLRNAMPETLVRSILSWPQGDAPVAWGAAENQGTGGAPQTYAQLFKGLGLNMLREHAQFKTGGYALEPSLDQIEQMMAGGKLKIHRKCHDLFEEIQGYERDENTGKPIPLRDDLIAALRYAVLMMRYAKVLDPERPRHGGIYRGVPLGQGLRRGRDADKSYFPDGAGPDSGYSDFGA